MVTLNKPAAGDTDWTTEINDNWTTLEGVANGALTVVKSADESVTSSTSPQDDDELKFTIGANETWKFEFVVFWWAANSTPDLKVKLNGPASFSNLRAHCSFWNVDAQTTSVGAWLTDYTMTASTNHAAAPDTLLIIRGSVVNGATAGTFVFQWAQMTSSATATTVRKGSYLVASKVS